MRTVLGYIDGRTIWSENVPAYGASFVIRGELAKPAPRPAKSAGLTPIQRKPEERAAAYQRTKRYRQKLRESA